MADEKNWRDAKIPHWVRDSFEAELRDAKLKAALAWPDFEMPEPVDFRWGQQDILTGDVEEGVFWHPGYQGVSKVEIRRADRTQTHKPYHFKRDGWRWSDSPVQGPLYRSKADALKRSLWDECRACAKKLADLRDDIESCRDSPN